MYNDTIIDGNDDFSAAFKKLTGEPVGYSVGRAAKILDMSKQAVDKAIRRGALVATRIYIVQNEKQKLISTEVDRESVHIYAAGKSGRYRVPKGFIASQHELPI